ncbi:MAG: PQQ-binding-like beta-propeller repeat protein, partial [Pirellulales bacterium]|nr:PQQ-binding-like beta-propeller repeat protein [Pirellulales bacterium]
DSRTGKLKWAQTILKLQQSWSTDSLMTLIKAGDRFIGVSAGTIVSMSHSGAVDWVKRNHWIPPALFPRDLVDQPLRPLITDGKLYVATRTTPEVQCIDVNNGKTLWSCVMPKSCRIVGTHGSTLLVDTRDSLFGVALQNGSVVWRHEAQSLRSRSP